MRDVLPRDEATNGASISSSPVDPTSLSLGLQMNSTTTSRPVGCRTRMSKGEPCSITSKMPFCFVDDADGVTHFAGSLLWGRSSVQRRGGDFLSAVREGNANNKAETRICVMFFEAHSLVQMRKENDKTLSVKHNIDRLVAQSNSALCSLMTWEDSEELITVS